jgi:hypothetical protein
MDFTWKGGVIRPGDKITDPIEYGSCVSLSLHVFGSLFLHVCVTWKGGVVRPGDKITDPIEHESCLPPSVLSSLFLCL